MEIRISHEIKELLPSAQLGILQMTMDNTLYNEKLWAKIQLLQTNICEKLQVKDISRLTPIAAARKAYKKLGKDPARYRLSAEALLRRTLKGTDLYQINTKVDVINYLSIKTGLSIGGYDVQKINGNIEWSVGHATDVYEGVGRGILNIENLPVLRDELGAFGSPTSDSERTSIQFETKEWLLVFFDFEGREVLAEKLQEYATEVSSFFDSSVYTISIVR